MFWPFCHEACGTRDQTCIGCIRRWSLNHWTNREVKLRLYYGFSQFCFNIHRYQISWGFIGIFRANTLLLKHVSEGDSEHVTYLLLHNKLPQGFSALKQQSILISHRPEGCLAVSSASCVHGQGAQKDGRNTGCSWGRPRGGWVLDWASSHFVSWIPRRKSPESEGKSCSSFKAQILKRLSHFCPFCWSKLVTRPPQIKDWLWGGREVGFTSWSGRWH